MKTQDIEKRLSGNATTPDPSFPKEGTTQLGLSASITTSANTAATANTAAIAKTHISGGDATTPDPSFPKEGTTQLGLSASITTSANTAAIATEGKHAEATDAASGDIWLSPHFRLSEFTRSGAALRLRLENKPTPEAIDNLRLLCQHVLEPLRRRFGVIRVTSGYRSPALNKAVGGATHSQHLTGQAADIHAGGRESLHRMAQYAAEHLPFDQIIEEHRRRDGARWLHISYNAKGNRREQLTIDN